VENVFNVEAWRQIVVRALSELGGNVAGFLPHLVGAALILLLGWALSRSLEVVASRGLRTLGLDRAAARLRVAELLERAEVPLSLSEIVAKLVFWLVMLTFVLSSVETLGLTAVTSTIDRLIGFIPAVIGAALTMIAGLLLARFVATLVSSGAAAAGFLSAPRLGFLAQLLVAGLVACIAIEQLGIDTDVLLVPFTALIATAGLAAGLAFALGARPVVTHILAGHFLRQSLSADALVEVQGLRGVVERVGPVDTLIKSEERRFSVPNAQLLEHVVLR